MKRKRDPRFITRGALLKRLERANKRIKELMAKMSKRPLAAGGGLAGGCPPKVDGNEGMWAKPLPAQSVSLQSFCPHCHGAIHVRTSLS